ncbi:MAG: SOS response-associated peptidase [Deltaproteobacteria bacterium]|nr:SOS response-associated peptidase [Deltaproteobacteria bacterium]
MCGRFTQLSELDDLQDRFGFPAAHLNWRPRYNLAPGQEALVVRLTPTGEREGVLVRWGLVPHWAKDPKVGYKMINARAESAADKPAFRSPFRHRRCLVPADGFFEWRQGPGGREPFYFRRADGQPFALAGLWDLWRPPGEADAPLLTAFTILTTAADPVVARIHPRMPVILPPEREEAWLSLPPEDVPELSHLLTEAPPEPLTAHPVSPRVNSPAVDEPSLLDPLPAAGGLFDPPAGE